MGKLKLVAILFLSLIILPVTTKAQSVAAPLQYNPTQQPQAQPNYSEGQLEQMVAPVALYPDPLLGQVFMASTYPLEIVEASRWLQNSGNASLTGNQLSAALEQQPWDPSVKSLVAFPQVLHMMDTNLQWTEQLGDAFLAQQTAVTNTVQQLRQKAQAAGSLSSTPQQVVATDGSDITIEPQNPDVVYVPAYNPTVVYGAWAYPAYPPYYFYPPGYVFGAALIGFGAGIYVVDSLWGWDRWDWRNHRIDIDNGRFAALNRGQASGSGVWQHDPLHRRGVPYRSTAVSARFQASNASESRRSLRGYSPAASAAAAQTSHAASFAARSATVSPQAEGNHFSRGTSSFAAPQRSAVQRTSSPGMFESFSHGSEVRAQSSRGSISRSSAASFSAPRASSAPRSASGGGFRGGGGGGGGGRGTNTRR